MTYIPTLPFGTSYCSLKQRFKVHLTAPRLGHRRAIVTLILNWDSLSLMATDTALHIHS